MQRFILLISLSLLILSCQTKKKYVFNEGLIYGTIYHVVYESPDGKDYQSEIESRMHSLGKSLSTFDSTSVISRINSNDSEVLVDEDFRTVFVKAQEISEKTGGAFDMTVAPLVNAWGFGFKHKEKVTSELVDSLLKTVGYKKVKLKENRIVKDNLRTMLDASAIAKGYSVDLVAKLLKEKGCGNYMVEIGGEVVAHGVNSKGKIWRIGINKPIDDQINQQNELEAIVQIKNSGMATSGNYRNFYIENGKKYAHTIDPASGYPVQHNVLSASVLASDCMTADAYATSFMVMGLEKAQAIVEADPELEAFFIYADDNGNNKVWYSEGFGDLLAK